MVKGLPWVGFDRATMHRFVLKKSSLARFRSTLANKPVAASLPPEGGNKKWFQMERQGGSTLCPT